LPNPAEQRAKPNGLEEIPRVVVCLVQI
jgi:hypothetical protein